MPTSRTARFFFLSGLTELRPPANALQEAVHENPKDRVARTLRGAAACPAREVAKCLRVRPWSL